MTTQPVYLVIGCPCSGKSWVCEQLTTQYSYVRHDDYMNDKPGRYVGEIIGEAKVGIRPVLCETPFSVSQIKDPLEKAGLRVVPVFIIEDAETLGRRYQAREGKPIPAGHLTRQDTYKLRANAWQAYKGTSLDVRNHLFEISGVRYTRPWPWE